MRRDLEARYRQSATSLKLNLGVLLIVIGTLSVWVASAETLYSNGAFPLPANAWNIRSGYTVAGSFLLSERAIVTGAEFGIIESYGNSITQIDWSITSAPDGTGTTHASGTAVVTLVTDFGGQGYENYYWDSFPIPDLDLAAGTYWLALRNAVLAAPPNALDSTYWLQGGGTSRTWQSTYGYLDPESRCGGNIATIDPDGSASCGLSFAINGISVAPDPASLLQQLAGDVVGVGPGKSLSDKVALAQTYYAMPDVQATCAVLADFNREVTALAGKKKLTAPQASELTSDANEIMTAIGCN